MKKLLALSISSILLTACGGGSDSGATKSTPTPTAPSIQTPTTTNTEVNLKINHPDVGQTLLFQSNQPSSDLVQSLSNKKYFARFTYCNTSGYYETCTSTRFGQLSFTLVKDGDKFLLKDLNVDKLVRVQAYGTNRPEIITMPTGLVGIAEATLTPLPNSNSKNQYQLTIIPASSVETKLPTIKVAVNINDNGTNLVSFDPSFMMIAQQMDTPPANWSQDSNKNSLAGQWTAYEPDYHFKINRKINITLNTNQGVEGTSNFVVNHQGQIFNGYYKAMSSGFVVGYASDNKPLNNSLSNYRGVNGFTILAPNGQYALGYDFDINQPYKQVSLLFR